MVQGLWHAGLVLKHRRADPVAEWHAVSHDALVLVEQCHAAGLAFGALDLVHVSVVELGRHDLESSRLRHNKVAHQLRVDARSVVCVLLGGLDLLEHQALDFASRLHKFLVGHLDLGVCFHLSLHDLSLVVDELACLAACHHFAGNAQVVDHHTAELGRGNVGLVLGHRDCDLGTSGQCCVELITNRRRHLGHAFGQA